MPAALSAALREAGALPALLFGALLESGMASSAAALLLEPCRAASTVPYITAEAANSLKYHWTLYKCCSMLRNVLGTHSCWQRYTAMPIATQTKASFRRLRPVSEGRVTSQRMEANNGVLQDYMSHPVPPEGIHVTESLITICQGGRGSKKPTCSVQLAVKERICPLEEQMALQQEHCSCAQASEACKP